MSVLIKATSQKQERGIIEDVRLRCVHLSQQFEGDARK